MTDNTPDQIDPFGDAAETLLYGDPDIAKEKLRTAIIYGAAQTNAHQERQGRLRAEHARSMDSLRKFSELNDAFEDPLVQAAGRAAMVNEQYNDLTRAGFLNVEKFRETTGRNPTDADIFNLHLEARANGVRGLRSTEKLLDDVAATIEEKFGVKRRITDIDQNRTHGARSMVNERRALRGLPPEEFGDDQPAPRARSRDGDRPVSDTTPEQYTRDQFGYGRDADDAVDAQMAQSRKNAIADRLSRNLARDRNVRADVQVNMDRDSRRYPDRRGAAAG
jgi:hypothetical protein